MFKWGYPLVDNRGIKAQGETALEFTQDVKLIAREPVETREQQIKAREIGTINFPAGELENDLCAMSIHPER